MIEKILFRLANKVLRKYNTQILCESCSIKLKFWTRPMTINVSVGRAIISSPILATNPITLANIKADIVFSLKCRWTKVKGELPLDQTFAINIRKGKSTDCLVALSGFSISKFKNIFSQQIISQFLHNIVSDSILDIKASYQHDNSVRFPKLYTQLYRHGTFSISPESVRIDKKTILDLLREKNHLSCCYLRYEDIPELAKVSIISTEDPMFWLHRGFSEVSMGMALRRDVNDHRLSVGGSSITQQLVKNAMLTPEHTLYRKTEELILSLLMENYYNMSKEEILELYLNMVEFAPGVYGINDGAQFYFGKTCKSLNLIEMLTLTYIIPRSPFFLDALTSKTEQLKHNLQDHLRRFVPTVMRKMGSESVYEIPSCIVFAKRFGTLDFVSVDD